jgi:hypothetical protein
MIFAARPHGQHAEGQRSNGTEEGLPYGQRPAMIDSLNATSKNKNRKTRHGRRRQAETS